MMSESKTLATNETLAVNHERAEAFLDGARWHKCLKP